MSRKKSFNDEHDEFDDGEFEGRGQKSEKGLGDILKKVISVGVGSAFMTEEAVKSVINELPLPKDILNGLLQNAKQAKSDFIDTVRDELKDQFNKVDPSKLVDDLVERYDIEVKASIKFKKKDQGSDAS
jgi:hypothetical protein